MHEIIEPFFGYWTMPEIATNLIVVVNIIGALFLGLLVGYERSYRGRAAGMRTYGLVCMASCALTVLSGYPEFWFGYHSDAKIVDPSRIIQGIVSGIGFLGAGVIMRDGLNISGLTTAASIWVVATIGILIGIGFYGAAIMLALLSAGFMFWGSQLEAMLPSRHAVAVTIRFKPGICPSEDVVRQRLNEQGYEIARGSFAISEEHSAMEWRFVALSKGLLEGATMINFSCALAADQEIDTFNISHARN